MSKRRIYPDLVDSGDYYFIGPHAQIIMGSPKLRIVAQNGTVTISRTGELCLNGTHGDLIDSALLPDEVSVEYPLAMGQTAHLFLNGCRYRVTLEARFARLLSGDPFATLGTQAQIQKAITLSTEATNQLIEAIENFPSSLA